MACPVAHFLNRKRGEQAVLVFRLINRSNHDQIFFPLSGEQMQSDEQVSHFHRVAAILADSQQYLRILDAIRKQGPKSQVTGILEQLPEVLCLPGLCRQQECYGETEISHARPGALYKTIDSKLIVKASTWLDQTIQDRLFYGAYEFNV